MIFQLIAILAPFITTPYVSRVLGADGIGEYSYGLSVVTYFAIFGTLGITTYGQIEIAKIRDNQKQLKCLITEVMAARVLTMLLSCITYISVIALSNAHSKMLLVLLLYLLSQISDVSWILQGLEEFQSLVIRNIIIKIVNIVMLFLFIQNRTDLYLYAGIMQGTVFVGNFFLWPYVWKYFLPSIFSINVLLKHWRASMAYFIPTVATTIYTVLDKSMIGWITHSDFQNGFYEQAHKIEQILVVVLTSLGTVTLPRITNMFNKHDDKGIKIIMKKTITLVLFISIPMCFGLIAIADRFIPLFLGKGYNECIILTQIFSLLIIVVGLDNTIGRQCLMAANRQNLFNKGVIWGAIVNVCLNLILIPKLGAIGAAISSVCAELLILVIFVYYSKDLLDFSIKKSLVNYLVSATLMFILLKTLELKLNDSIFSIIVIITAGVCFYIIGLLIMKESLAKEILIQSINFLIKRKHF